MSRPGIVLEKEKMHHDKWASEIDVAAIDVVRNFEASTVPENRFILDNIGEIKDKRILDLGCGAGESGVYFALKGGQCVSTDYSPIMMETARKLAEKYGVTVDLHVMNAMGDRFS